jgi:nicotinate-nucleotide adenylyltransferase
VDGRIKICTYEKDNELAGETYHLVKKMMTDPGYENFNFSFIMGQDNANTFDKWVNYAELERMIRFVIVPRVGYKPVMNAWYLKEPHIFLNGEGEEPIMSVSSTQVRNLLKEYSRENDPGLRLELLKILDEKVLNYILEHKFL